MLSWFVCKEQYGKIVGGQAKLCGYGSMLMEILFYRYNSICEPDVIAAFGKLGITVVEKNIRSSGKELSEGQLAEQTADLIRKHSFLFVFSINFFPNLSDICELLQVPYICWTVDVPVLTLFSQAVKNKCNRIFLFDRSQYLYFKERNPEGIFYLPLATNPDRWDRVIGSASNSEKKRFESGISFVGSLYSEKNAFRKIEGMSDYAKGYIRGLVEAQLLVYGANLIEGSLTDEIMNELDSLVPDMHQPLCEGDGAAQRYLIAHSFIGSELAQTERVRLLNALAAYFDVDLYTLSNTEELSCVRRHGGVNSQTEMPLVFHESRINLNITMRPIATGLSLRVFDVCGCGGFLMTNWQEELPEMYEPGVEVDYFTSEEELLEKAGYYLEHEDERKAIALRGYERTKSEHTYDSRIAEMIRVVNGTL